LSISLDVLRTQGEVVEIEVRWDHKVGQLQTSFDPNILPVMRLGKILGGMYMARHQRTFEVCPFDDSQPTFKANLVHPLSVLLRRQR
jgi:hypothetical protein